jgi:hypothetical protein
MELNALVNLTLRCTSMRIATRPDIVLRSSWTVGELLLRDMLAGVSCWDGLNSCFMCILMDLLGGNTMLVALFWLNPFDSAYLVRFPTFEIVKERQR